MDFTNDLQRDIALNIVRVTEVAALRASRWMGKGDKKAADKAAVDGMRGMLDMLTLKGVVVLGEGEKDEAPMLYNGEIVGNCSEGCVEVDIAVDPIDGTTLVAKGTANALAVIAVSERHSMAFLPTFYAMKIAYGSALKGIIDINSSVTENLIRASTKLNKSINDLTVAVLDRPRHDDIIREIREAGSRIKLISDGDIATALSAAFEDGNIDLSIGIGGSPEAILAAAGIKCLDGDIQVKLYTKDEQERKKLIEEGYDFDKVYFAEDLVRGENVFLAVTGVTDGDLLDGVKYIGQKAITHSIVLRSKTKTIRKIEAHHNLKCKTIPSKELKEETKI